MCKNARMDWDGLRLFLAVARAGRMSVAARQLGVDHTTVGRRLAAFEDALGAPLFHRTAAGHLLTSVGKDVLAAAERMEEAAVAIERRARQDAGTIRGRVRVALAPEFGSHWLGPHLPAFRARHPEIDLHILVGTRQRDLSRGEAELAVQSPRPRQTGLVAVRIARAAMGLYASRAFLAGRRLRIDGAASARDLPLLVYTPQLHVLQGAAWFQAVLQEARIVLETNSTHTLLAAARAGAGIAVLPRFVARRESELLAVSDPVAENDIWLVTHPDFRRDPRIRATADFLKQAAAGPGGIGI